MTAGTAGVLVGLSGGVDSAVAASLLVERGYHVVGVTLRLSPDEGSGRMPRRGSVEAIDRARALAEGLGIPYHVVDARAPFQEQVVKYFIEEHMAGRTPNPCVKCNARVRFGLLVEIAGRMGLDHIATGHYARMTGEPRGLARGIDRVKDQSYVLAEVDPGLLRRTIFPLGEMTKVEVKARAVELGLVDSSTVESQEICFIPDNDHRRFLRERLGERPGVLVDRRGEIIGHHAGTYNFTIGQRKRIGLAGAKPLYVVGLAAARGEVVVGEACELGVGAVAIEEVVRHRPVSAGPMLAQLRSTGDAVPALMDGPETIVLEEPLKGIAPGQTAVLYEGDAVVLAGTIVATQAWA
ncbi:MAG: tRNA 2-thiouridine(34) synthase MnmA [Thermoleophilia bacterium]|nr:tRNA 2-thiouridine(34) synthase MnmA [Thermoleophilia bacterium]